MTEDINDQIRRALDETRTIAVVGASPNPARASFAVTQVLAEHGYRVFPVNPGHAGETIAGLKAYGSLAEIPEPIDMVDVFRRSEHVGPVMDEALALQPRPKVFWTQLDVRDEAAAARGREAGMTVIMDRCPAIELARLGRIVHD